LSANPDRVLFPGALNSEFTNTLEFLRPSKTKGAIPTYRVLNQYGEIIDTATGADTEDAEALELYKNMVKRGFNPIWAHCIADGNSEHHGPPHVRGPTAGKTELLHGTYVPTIRHVERN
jgi:hypothetical protein